MENGTKFETKHDGRLRDPPVHENWAILSSVKIAIILPTPFFLSPSSSAYLSRKGISFILYLLASVYMAGTSCQSNVFFPMGWTI